MRISKPDEIISVTDVLKLEGVHDIKIHSKFLKIRNPAYEGGISGTFITELIVLGDERFKDVAELNVMLDKCDMRVEWGSYVDKEVKE